MEQKIVITTDNINNRYLSNPLLGLTAGEQDMFLKEVKVRMEKNPVNGNKKYTVHELISLVKGGVIISGSVFSFRIMYSRWKNQQVFFVDITVSEFENLDTNLLDKHGIRYFMAYKSVIGDKVILAFINDFIIKDRRVQLLVHYLLTKLFTKGNAENMTKDPSRIVYPASEMLKTNLDAVINIYKLYQCYVEKVSKENPAHKSREIENLCKSCGIKSLKNNAVIRIINENGKVELENRQKKDERGFIQILDAPDKVKNYIYIGFATSDVLFKQNGSKIKIEKMKQVEFEDLECTKQKRNRDITKIENKCMLYKEFEKGILSKANTASIEHIIKNLIQLSGGKSKILKIAEDIYKDRSYFSTLSAAAKGTGCSFCSVTNCNYYKDCKERLGTIVNLIDCKKGEIRKVEESSFITVAEQRKQIKSIIKRFLKEENKIYLLKSPMGSGKTTILCELIKEDTLIVVPNELLMNEICKKLDSKGIEYIAVRPMPRMDKDFMNNLEHLYSTGNVSEIYKLVSGKAAEIKNKMVRTEEEIKFIEYQEALRDVNNTDKVVLITHARFMLSKHIKQKNIFIDEDIMFSEMLKINSINIDDFNKVLNVLKVENLYLYSKLSNIVINMNFPVTQETNSDSLKIPTEVFSVPELTLEEKKIISGIVQKLGWTISTNISQFLESKGYMIYYKKDKLTINYVLQRELPRNKNIMIMSATLSKPLYKFMYEDCNVRTISQSRNAGFIYQHAKHSYSRNYTAKNLKKVIRELDERIKSAYPEKEFKLISFKNLFEDININEFINVDAGYHYGNTAGLNCMEGENLVIYGTPYLAFNDYVLLAYGMGIEFNESIKCQYDKVTRNEHEFWSLIFDTDLKKDESAVKFINEIMFTLIESIMMQAAGRNRHNIHDCITEIYSSIMLRQAIAL